MREPAVAVPRALAKALTITPKFMASAMMARRNSSRGAQRRGRTREALRALLIDAEAQGLGQHDDCIEDTHGDHGRRDGARMSRRGLFVSSPKDAAPSKPAKERRPKTAARATVLRPTPLGSVKGESVKL